MIHSQKKKYIKLRKKERCKVRRRSIMIISFKTECKVLFFRHFWWPSDYAAKLSRVFRINYYYVLLPIAVLYFMFFGEILLLLIIKHEASVPSKHVTLFWRPHNVHNVKTTSYGRQNNVVCVLGYLYLLLNQ